MRKGFKILTIATALLAIVEIIVFNALELDDPMWKWDFHYFMQWTFIILCPVCACVWYYYYTAEVKEQERVETLKRKEEERIRKEEKKVEVSKAYDSISDIWEYGNRTMLAVLCSEEEEGGIIYYLSVNYSRVNETPWIISINSAREEQGFGLSKHEFKAKRSGNNLVGINGDDIAVLSKGKLTLGDEVLYFDLENNLVKKIKDLMELLLTKKTIETVRVEHLKAGAGIIDALPKFHFSFNENGIMCDEINYPKKHLEDFFERNNGGEQLFQNKIFYEEYCKNKGLYTFDAFHEIDFNRYMRDLKMRALKSGYSCKTDFELSEWQVSINSGVESLFKSFRTYVDNKTLDVVPCAFDEDSILFKHKLYAPRKNKSMMFRDLAIALMVKSLANEDPTYAISKKDDGRIFIDINGEQFISIENELSSKP